MVTRQQVVGAPDFDPAAAVPDAARWREAVRTKDWPALEAAFAELADVDDRAFAVSVIAELEGAEVFLREVAEREPSGLARVLLAARWTAQGWQARTGARARHVSAGQFALFHEFLRKAEQLLIDVVARHPDDGPAWSQRIQTAIGLQLGQSEARRRYARLAAHHPRFLHAQRRMVQQLSPKWGGSWDAVFAFARERAAEAPPGSPAAVLIVDAHLEQWVDNGGNHLQRADVRQELVEAAERSVLHPDFRAGYWEAAVRNTFAMAFGLSGGHGRAAEQFRALGTLATKLPWAYLGDEAAAFQRYRTLALGKGDGRA